MTYRARGGKQPLAFRTQTYKYDGALHPRFGYDTPSTP